MLGLLLIFTQYIYQKKSSILCFTVSFSTPSFVFLFT